MIGPKINSGAVNTSKVQLNICSIKIVGETVHHAGPTFASGTWVGRNTFLRLACARACSSCFSRFCNSFTFSGPRSSPSKCLNSVLRVSPYYGVSLLQLNRQINTFPWRCVIIEPVKWYFSKNKKRAKPLSLLERFIFCLQFRYFLKPVLLS